jgi:GMP synthase (glutamine-hydrolysing)
VGAVIFGGPMSANDHEPHIRRETDWLEVPLREGKPFLGICLGAQMLVRHLGGTVGTHPDGYAEIGWYPIDATEEGRRLGEWPEMVYQFHREGFDLPTDAVLLARGTGAYPNQAFRYGDNAWGIQFHAELTQIMMQRWVVRGARRFELPGAQQGRLHLEGRMRYDAPLRKWLSQFLAGFLGPGLAGGVFGACSGRGRFVSVPDGGMRAIVQSCRCRASPWMRRNLGKMAAQAPATASVPTPPMTTAGIDPRSAAMPPARNSPSSFEAPTNTMLTALTRPRSSSGVQSWMRVWRT